jgi:hypothetical protein
MTRGAKNIVTTFSRNFLKGHPKEGQPTQFIEKIWKSLGGVSTEYTNKFIDGTDYKKSIVWGYQLVEGVKYHTIRAGHRFQVGDFLVPKVWSGKPYRSKPIQIAPPIEIVKTWDFECHTENDDGESDWSFIKFLDKQFTCYSNEYLNPVIKQVAQNDGFTDPQDFLDWIRPKTRHSEPLIGQIICWNKSIEYTQLESVKEGIGNG